MHRNNVGKGNEEGLLYPKKLSSHFEIKWTVPSLALRR